MLGYIESNCKTHPGPFEWSHQMMWSDLLSPHLPCPIGDNSYTKKEKFQASQETFSSFHHSYFFEVLKKRSTLTEVAVRKPQSIYSLSSDFLLFGALSMSLSK